MKIMDMYNIGLKIADGLSDLFAYKAVKRIAQKLTDTFYPFLVLAKERLYLMCRRKCLNLFEEDSIFASGMLIEIVYDENTHEPLGFHKDSISLFYPYLRVSFFSYVSGISTCQGFSGLFRES